VATDARPRYIRLEANILRLRNRECRAPVNLAGVDGKTRELNLNEKTLLYW